MDTLPVDELDISNDPEVERLGANATVQYAQEYWNTLYRAAQRDSYVYDPLWNDQDLDKADEAHRCNDGNNRSYYTKQIILTQSKEQDYRLYRRFRSNLSRVFWNVEQISVPEISTTTNGSTATASSMKEIHHHNPLCNDKWQSLLLACEGVIPDFNFITLLRPNVYDFPYHDDLLAPAAEVSQDQLSLLSQYIIVPRMQFIYIEIARCYEGYYSTKKFRQQLQIYTIKGIEETLHDVFRTKLLPALSCEMNGNSKNGTNGVYSTVQKDIVRVQKTMLQQLHRLATEWPFPSIFAIRTTGIVSTLQCILRRIERVGADPQQQSILQTIQDACQLQLQNWHDLIQLRRIEKSLPDLVSTNNIQHKYADSIQRLLQKTILIHGSAGSERETPWCSHFNHKQMSLSANSEQWLGQQRNKYIHDGYVTRTTSTLSDIIVSLSSLQSHDGLENGSNGSGSKSIASIFRHYGIVIFSNYCTEQQIEQCSDQAYMALERLQQEQFRPQNILINGQNAFDYVEVRQRPGHRVDNRYKLLENPHSPIATLGQHILKEVDRHLFSNKNVSEIKQLDNATSSSSWKLLYAGVVHAFPRENETMDHPPSQFWHRDGPSLFDSQHVHHPTHCFNVFVPLIDVNQVNGTTEFVPGTHEDKRHNKVVADLLLNQFEKYERDAGTIRADLKAGSLIFFDVRVLHRGLSNQSDVERPMLYYTFGRDWFQEQHMFQKIESLLAPARRLDDNVLDVSIITFCNELFATVAGQQLVQTYPPLSCDGGKNIEYGHPHYTLRFDLLLLEQWMTSNGDSLVSATPAMKNHAAVLRFHNLSTKEKDDVCHHFVHALSSPAAWEMKNHQLELTRRKREEQRHPSAEMFDFASIQHDMSDVAVLYNLTVQLLLTPSSQESSKGTLLSQLGFTQDENGICVALALLKVYASSKTIGNSVVPYAELEECFTLWWNAAPSPSRFHLVSSTYEPADVGRDLRSVIVVFSSLGSGLCRPEWMGTLKAIGVYNQMPQVDVLHVVDFAYSWYSQDPTCTWNGYEYYMNELNQRLQPYNKVFFLGDSMGGSAALRFSSLAHAVLVFTPQIDLSNYEAVTRKDFTSERREQFHQEVVETMRDDLDNKAIVTIHYGKHCVEDVRQLQPLFLEHKSNVQFVGHDFEDHVLSLHLRDVGILKGLVYDAIVKQFLSL